MWSYDRDISTSTCMSKMFFILLEKLTNIHSSWWIIMVYNQLLNGLHCVTVVSTGSSSAASCSLPIRRDRKKWHIHSSDSLLHADAGVPRCARLLNYSTVVAPLANLLKNWACSLWVLGDKLWKSQGSYLTPLALQLSPLVFQMARWFVNSSLASEITALTSPSRSLSTERSNP